MASKQLVNKLAKLGCPRQNWMSPLAAVRQSSSRSDIEKVTHTGQVRILAISQTETQPSCDYANIVWNIYKDI